MKKLLIITIALSALAGCRGKGNQSGEMAENNPETQSATTENMRTKDFASLRGMLVDSLLYFRHQHLLTDILSRHLPDLTREESSEIQLQMLEKELAAGARLIGWKMAGTVTDDQASYDPLFGYILDKNMITEDSMVVASNFPGGEVMVEGEIGFVMKEDFKNGAQSMEELKAGIDYVVGTVEFARSIAVPFEGNPETMNINHTMASGMGQAGIMVGTEKVDLQEFDMKNETVKCYINDELAAEGVASNVYGTPLNALYSLANMLPKHGKYLRKGDIIVTGSVYKNPTIDNTCEVRLAFSNLGTIRFKMK